MPQYSSGTTLAAMLGAVRLHKPNASPDQITNWLNWRVRQMIDMRPYWAGLITRGVINCPAAYTTGTFTSTTGSTVIQGQSTNWPTNDVVNTQLGAAISRPGAQQAIPLDMTNITDTSLLYIGGATPEIVAVTSTTQGAFTANFSTTHLQGEPITCSSLAGMQFKPGYMNPIYTVMGVTSPASLTLDFPWGGSPITTSSYIILKMYYTIATDIKDLLSVIDPRQGLDLVLHYPLANLNNEDPQRASLQFPQFLADHSVDANGNAVYELWPAPISPYVLYFQYYKQWKDMQAPGDGPPPFIDPAIIIAGAIAYALVTKMNAQDPYYDLNAAKIWEGRFLSGVDIAMQADNGKVQQQYTWQGRSQYPAGSTWSQSHDYDVWGGNW